MEVVKGLERALALASGPKINRGRLRHALMEVLAFARELDAAAHTEAPELGH